MLYQQRIEQKLTASVFKSPVRTAIDELPTVTTADALLELAVDVLCCGVDVAGGVEGAFFG